MAGLITGQGTSGLLGAAPLACLYQHTRGKRRFHFSPARSRTEASWRSDLCPPAWLVRLLEFPRAVSVCCRERSGGPRLEAATASTAAEATTSVMAKTGSSKFAVSVAVIGSKTALSRCRAQARRVAHRLLSGRDTGRIAPRRERFGAEVAVSASRDEMTRSGEDVVGRVQGQETLG